ncbi:oxidoreductase [Paenibacillus sp. BIHB 4019]|uniref:Oxidoreductase n=1 Tax=Paenibacillus sp. BIHB 4019 TaxID=1870819 RepID=A0A1B2DHJ2_9BACL|nr:NAD(P)H-binding protein [Paenibacillus sp. BIHB 4019]ANY67145.1 oxidoreductase [Paenibacillus sp. BIHB 4019]
MKRKAVVAGATGLIGKELVQLLLDDQAYSAVTLLVRRTTGMVHPKLVEQVIDFDQLQQTDVEMNGADVYCTLGTTIKKAGSQDAFRKVDYEYPLSLGLLASRQGAKQLLLVSAIGAKASSRTFYTRVKGEVEEALRSLGLPALHIFRPSLLLGKREEFRFGERLAAALSGVLSPLYSGPLRKYAPVEAGTVAKAMILAAKSGQAGIHMHENEQIVKVKQTS